MNPLLPVLCHADFVVAADAIYRGGLGGVETPLSLGLSLRAPSWAPLTTDDTGPGVMLSPVLIDSRKIEPKRALKDAYRLLCVQERVINYSGGVEGQRFSLVHVLRYREGGMMHTLRFTPHFSNRTSGNLLFPSHHLEAYGWEVFQEEFLFATESGSY